jgi:hypothetical protein
MTTTTSRKRWRMQVSEQLEDSPILKAIVIILFLGLATGLIVVALINLRPYTLLMNGLGEHAGWVTSIPWLGGLLMNLGGGFKYLGAVLIWAPVQILECLWLLILLDAKAQKNAVKTSIALQEDMEQAQGSRTNAETRRAVKRVARIPFFFTKWAILLALGAYVFDLVVGIKVYPVWSNWQTFTLWIKSLNPMWINQPEAINLGIMLFSFEAVLVLTVIVGQWLFMSTRD